MVREPASPGVSPLCPNTAAPFRDNGTATKSSAAGAMVPVTSHTVTRSLSIIGCGVSPAAAKHSAKVKSAKGTLPRRQETEGTRIAAAARTRPVLRAFPKTTAFNTSSIVQ